MVPKNSAILTNTSFVESVIMGVNLEINCLFCDYKWTFIEGNLGSNLFLHLFSPVLQLQWPFSSIRIIFGIKICLGKQIHIHPPHKLKIYYTMKPRTEADFSKPASGVKLLFFVLFPSRLWQPFKAPQPPRTLKFVARRQDGGPRSPESCSHLPSHHSSSLLNSGHPQGAASDRRPAYDRFRLTYFPAVTSSETPPAGFRVPQSSLQDVHTDFTPPCHASAIDLSVALWLLHLHLLIFPPPPVLSVNQSQGWWWEELGALAD